MPAFAIPLPLTPPRRRRNPHFITAILHPDRSVASTPLHPARSPLPSQRVKPLPSPLPRPIRLSPRFTAESAQFSNVASSLTPSVYWRFLLLSDGHIIQHLVTLTGGRIRLILLGTSFSPETNRVQRRIALEGEDGHAVLYATTTWDYNIYTKLIAGREHIALWEVFKDNRLAFGREICAVHFGTCASLEGYFDVPRGSGMWARDYVFTREGRPMVSVHEVFSPKLATWLGPVVPPEGIVCESETDVGAREEERWGGESAAWKDGQEVLGE